jgi:hypothetical protein
MRKSARKTKNLRKPTRKAAETRSQRRRRHPRVSWLRVLSTTLVGFLVMMKSAVLVLLLWPSPSCMGGTYSLVVFWFVSFML